MNLVIETLKLNKRNKITNKYLVQENDFNSLRNSNFTINHIWNNTYEWFQIANNNYGLLLFFF